MNTVGEWSKQSPNDYLIVSISTWTIIDGRDLIKTALYKFFSSGAMPASIRFVWPLEPAPIWSLRSTATTTLEIRTILKPWPYSQEKLRLLYANFSMSVKEKQLTGLQVHQRIWFPPKLISWVRDDHSGLGARRSKALTWCSPSKRLVIIRLMSMKTNYGHISSWTIYVERNIYNVLYIHWSWLNLYIPLGVTLLTQYFIQRLRHI